MRPALLDPLFSPIASLTPRMTMDRLLPFPVPDHEPQRLLALRDFRVLDTLPQKMFDDITALAAGICGTPMALISLVDADRQWFKSRHGTTLSETPRDESFCAHTILERQTLVVPDALKDPRFRGNPLVTGKPWVRFYAGAILRLPYGPAVGTLCVMDTRPREMDRIGLAILTSLRDLVVEEMVRREVAG